MKLSMMVKPMPLRSSPPVEKRGCRAFSTSAMPRPQSRTDSSRTFPSRMRALMTIFPRRSG